MINFMGDFLINGINTYR